MDSVPISTSAPKGQALVIQKLNFVKIIRVDICVNAKLDMKPDHLVVKQSLEVSHHAQPQPVIISKFGKITSLEAGI